MEPLVRVKNEDALEYAEEYPRAITTITQNHYTPLMISSTVSTQKKKPFNLLPVSNMFTRKVDLKSEFGYHIQKWFELIGWRFYGFYNKPQLKSENTTEKNRKRWWNTNMEAFTYSLKENQPNEKFLKHWCQFTSHWECCRFSWFMEKYYYKKFGRSSIGWNEPGLNALFRKFDLTFN